MRAIEAALEDRQPAAISTPDFVYVHRTNSRTVRNSLRLLLDLNLFRVSIGPQRVRVFHRVPFDAEAARAAVARMRTASRSA